MTNKDNQARHVAIIMDGNGRWAKQRHLPRALGHKKGVEAVRELVRSVEPMDLDCLTLYAFSSENWKRPEDEVSDLMNLMRRFIKSDLPEFIANDVRLKIIGDYSVMAPDIVKMLEDALEQTAKGSRILAVALNYGGQQEIARAATLAMRDVQKRTETGHKDVEASLSGSNVNNDAPSETAPANIALADIEPEHIEPEDIERHLFTSDLPPLDLLIRTSGEIRLSNFLLWQSAYAEMMFVDTLWPDFTPAHLQAALDDFASRERRYGGR